jgi:hypothetical protein
MMHEHGVDTMAGREDDEGREGEIGRAWEDEDISDLAGEPYKPLLYNFPMSLTFPCCCDLLPYFLL